jgi:hypothetical protein
VDGQEVEMGGVGTKDDPLMDTLGLAELTHDAKSNRMRAR